MMKDTNEKELYDLAEIFKIFGDQTRIKILKSLLDDDKNVSQIVDELHMNQSAISHQLKILKESHLIKGQRDGKNIIYSLDDEHVRSILSQGLNHLRH